LLVSASSTAFIPTESSAMSLAVSGDGLVPSSGNRPKGHRVEHGGQPRTIYLRAVGGMTGGVGWERGALCKCIGGFVMPPTFAQVRQAVCLDDALHGGRPLRRPDEQRHTFVSVQFGCRSRHRADRRRDGAHQLDDHPRGVPAPDLRQGGARRWPWTRSSAPGGPDGGPKAPGLGSLARSRVSRRS